MIKPNVCFSKPERRGNRREEEVEDDDDDDEEENEREKEKDDKEEEEEVKAPCGFSHVFASGESSSAMARGRWKRGCVAG